jgi:hypothetical protein
MKNDKGMIFWHNFDQIFLFFIFYENKIKKKKEEDLKQ